MFASLSVCVCNKKMTIMCSDLEKSEVPFWTGILKANYLISSQYKSLTL